MDVDLRAISSLRERKKAKTRIALAQAAMELFQRKGYEATTIDEIADAAEVSRRTFFRYYPTKEAVLFPQRAERLAQFRQLLRREEPGDTPFATVRRACLALAAEFAKHRDELLEQQRVIESASSLMAYDLQLDREWEVAITEALVRDGTDPELRRRASLVAGAIYGCMRAGLREWFAGSGTLDLEAMAASALALLATGIGRAEGT